MEAHTPHKNNNSTARSAACVKEVPGDDRQTAAPLVSLVDRDRLVRTFTALVSKDSTSFAERAVCDLLTSELKARGVSAEEDSSAAESGGNCGNLYAFLPGTGSCAEKEPLLFCGHMDTVEPSRGKKAVVHTDGRITSAGDTVLGADDVSALAAILEALQIIEERKLPHRPIELLFSVAEEPYCAGIQYFSFERLRAKEAYVLDLAGPVGLAATKAPTILSFRAVFQGRAAHAGFAPEDGIHAICAAARAISSIQCGRISADTTVNIGTIQGGKADNIVPERCILSGEIRSFSDEKASRILQQIQSKMEEAAASLGAVLTFSSARHCIAYETSETADVSQRFAACCLAEGLTPKFCATYGGSDNNVLALHGIRGIVIANAMNQCHSTAEYTSIDELARVTGIVLRLMTDSVL